MHNKSEQELKKIMESWEKIHAEHFKKLIEKVHPEIKKIAADLYKMQTNR